MNLKIFALVAAIALASGVYAMSNIAQPVMAKNNPKCFSEQTKDRDVTLKECVAGTHDEESQIKDTKKECKEITDNKEIRCSSSQTGNGVFDKHP